MTALPGTVSRLSALVRSFGWLPLGQVLTFAISTVGFAILARVLGPEPYAKYTLVLVIFTVISLLTDLSPQSYALVHGVDAPSLAVARRLAGVSAVAGTILMAVFLLTAPLVLPPAALGWQDGALLVVTVAAQLAAQIPRSVLFGARSYRRLAISDVTAVAIGILLPIALSGVLGAQTVLIGQLALTAVLKLIFSSLAVCGVAAPTDSGNSTERHSLTAGVRFGLRILPLNLAAFLSRSLDSGLMPLLVPAASAATYARSYQVAVVPFTQLQLSIGPVVIERFARALRSSEQQANSAMLKLWSVLNTVAFGFGMALIVFCWLIALVLFGPEWPNVPVTLAAMGACLHGFGVLALGAWAAQVRSRLSRTISHFALVLVVPISVLITAAIGGYTPALIVLVALAGLVQPVLMCVLHRDVLPQGLPKAAGRVLLQGVIGAAAFAVVVALTGFL